MIEFDDLQKNSVVVVAGPTASGKSALALDIALKYNGVIINADAMQIYKGTPIIAATPTADDTKKVRHLLYEIFEPNQRGSVSEWLNLAVAAIKQVWREQQLPIVVGGTGFYIESLINGVSPIPETSDKVKAEVADIFDRGGVEALFAKLQKIDKKGAALVNPNDTTRVRRALEIFLDTKKSIDEWFKMPMIKKLPEADFRVVALLPELAQLEDKCAKRFDIMMENGALAEVQELLKMNLDDNLPAMKAIGVPELKLYLDGNISLNEAVSLAKLHTRQYAKRQLTWFRNRIKFLRDAKVCVVTEI